MLALQIFLIAWAGCVNGFAWPIACDAGDDCLLLGACILDKSWTNAYVVKESGSQVESAFALTSHDSFAAERKGD